MTRTSSRVSTAAAFLILTASLTAPGASTAEETISFPSRSSDLANDSYWGVSEFSEGCCTLDLNVRRWDGENWKGGTGSSTNEQDYDWNVPIYAPANGVIASCWRNFPDDPAPGKQPLNNNIFTGGNHVVIITDQGNAISLNHFRAGTIRADLCPPNAGTTQYPSTDARPGNWRVAAYIDPADRPRVTEGDYIGRAGNSGTSGGPHHHISMNKITGTDGDGREALAKEDSPLQFRYGWGHRFEADQKDTSDGWFRLRGGNFDGDPACAKYQANSPDCGFKMVHPSPYLRRTSASADTVKDIGMVFVSGLRAVTAVVDGANNLKLTSWDLVGVDKLNRRGEIKAGAITDAAIVYLSNHVLVAVRQSDGVLKMIAYGMTPSGDFVRVADFSAGKISALAMTTTRGIDRKAVTAVRDEGGNLKVIVWDLHFANNGKVSIARLGQASAGTSSALAITRSRIFNGVFTAVRDGANNLKIIPWKVSPDGKVVTPGASGSADAVGTQIDVAPLAQGVAAAVRDGQGNLRVITWSANSSGDIGARHDTSVGGGISEVSILGTPHAGSNLTTVVRDADGNLLLIGWAINDDGTNLRRLGSSKAGAATQIAADGVSRSYPGKDSRDMILTAFKDGKGDLMLITWDTNLVNP